MAPGQIRIIGGAWRGRKLKVPDLPGVRPTPDRVRETLFNWLQPVIMGAKCLDLFAGSGALGFEALSRGAALVEMVDHSGAVVKLLREEAEILKAENITIYSAIVPAQLKLPAVPFDIVFLDPPFDSGLLKPCCEFLEAKEFLADKAYIYLEAAKPLTEADLPANWQLIKNKKTGHVAYHLALRTKGKQVS